MIACARIGPLATPHVFTRLAFYSHVLVTSVSRAHRGEHIHHFGTLHSVDGIVRVHRTARGVGVGVGGRRLAPALGAHGLFVVCCPVACVDH